MIDDADNNIMKTTTGELSCYLLSKTIGKGTFGKVKKAIHKYTNEPVAVKILEKSKIKDITDVERVARQLHILKVIRHSAIAQLYEIIETPETIYIVMEYAENGQFFDYIMDGKIKDQEEAHHYFAQIVDGLEYLHRMRVSHRDIKPENMLLDANKRLKIVDFGLSNMYKDGEKLLTACGSPCYASPQMIRGEQYDPELTDVWSLGVVLFTMLMAKLPFQDDNTSVLYSKIKSGLYIIDKVISAEVKDLLRKLINVKADKRLRLSQIKQHAWFKMFSGGEGHGIHVGFQKIPIDEKVVKAMQNLGFQGSLTKRYLQYNVKNSCTATYYLFLKKNFKLGLGSTADICSDNFNLKLLGKKSTHNKPRRKSIDFNALIAKQDNQEYLQRKDLQRKYLSQAKEKNEYESRSVTKMSFDASASNKKSAKNTQKGKQGMKKEAINNSMERKNSKKVRLSSEIDENSSKNFGKKIRQNRRLKTEHIQQIYSKQYQQTSMKKKELQISQMFWKKRNTNANTRGATRYIQDEGKSYKSVMKNNYF